MPRPLDEGLHDDLGTHPMRPNARKQDSFCERGPRNFERIELCAKLQQQVRIEARARPSGEDEIFVFEIADEQRAQTNPPALRGRGRDAWWTLPYQLHPELDTARAIALRSDLSEIES